MLYQLSYSRPGLYVVKLVAPAGGGGEGRIRTFEGISRQIYSLLPLATRVPLRLAFSLFPSSLGADGQTRTGNLLITNQVLYQLSYIGTAKNRRIPRLPPCGLPLDPPC